MSKKIIINAVTRDSVYNTFFPLAGRIKNVLEQDGFKADLNYVPNCTLIEHVRSYVSTISHEEGADVQLWFDDDVTFEPADARRLVNETLEMQTCIAAPVAMRGCGINVGFMDERVGFYNMGGLYRISRAGMGLTAIHRNVFTAIAETLPRVEIMDNCVGYPFFRSAFFRTPGRDVLRWKGEDYTFTMRARRAGFEVWADTRIRCLHHAGGALRIEDAIGRPADSDGFTIPLPPNTDEEETIAED
jgi:hypothetical protein